MEQIVFYSFATLIVLSALCVVSLNNPIYNVLSLVLAFLGSAGLYMLLKAEFLAMVLITVYVGAVAVFFLFVVMTLAGSGHEVTKKISQDRKIMGSFLGFIFTVEMSLIIFTRINTLDFVHNAQSNTLSLKNLTLAIFTQNLHLLEVSGVILLVAMIGAIVISSYNIIPHELLLKQNVRHQNARSREEVVKIVSVEFGKGIK